MQNPDFWLFKRILQSSDEERPIRSGVETGDAEAEGALCRREGNIFVTAAARRHPGEVEPQGAGMTKCSCDWEQSSTELMLMY